MAAPASRMQNFSLSPTAAMLAKVTELRQQGKDIISLNIGEPDFDTPAFIRKAAAEAMDTGFTRYTTESGFPELPIQFHQHIKILVVYQVIRYFVLRKMQIHGIHHKITLLHTIFGSSMLFENYTPFSHRKQSAFLTDSKFT